MAIVGAIVSGILGTYLTLGVWKQYEIGIAKMQNVKQKLAMGSVLVLHVFLYLQLFLNDYPITTYANILIFHTILIAIAGIDLQDKLIPNKVLLWGIGLRTVVLIMEFLFYRDIFVRELINSVVGMIFGLLFLLLLCWISKHGIGYGDVKLFAWIGYCMGLQDTYSILFYSALTAAVVGLYLLFIKKESRKKEIPFGPFVWAGAYIVILLSVLS